MASANRHMRSYNLHKRKKVLKKPFSLQIFKRTRRKLIIDSLKGIKRIRLYMKKRVRKKSYHLRTYQTRLITRHNRKFRTKWHSHKIRLSRNRQKLNKKNSYLKLRSSKKPKNRKGKKVVLALKMLSFVELTVEKKQNKSKRWRRYQRILKFMQRPEFHVKNSKKSCNTTGESYWIVIMMYVLYRLRKKYCK